MTHLDRHLRDATRLDPGDAVTGAGRRTLEAIFRHPLSHNLSWREVVGLFTTIGAAEEKRNGEFEFRAGDESLTMKRPHNKDLTGPEVMGLRHFLTRTGWSPEASSASKPESLAATPAMEAGLIVVIDHSGAKVYTVDPLGHDVHGATAQDPRHLLHHLERKRRDEDRDENYPDDEHFFKQVANALSVGGKIVVIGHGKGQSNEANHLSAYLSAHHTETHKRIVQEIVADLPHLTTPQLLDLGRHALR